MGHVLIKSTISLVAYGQSPRKNGDIKREAGWTLVVKKEGPGAEWQLIPGLAK